MQTAARAAVQVPARADLRQPHPRRRDQPRAGESAVGAARGDGGAAGHGRPARPTRCPTSFIVLATAEPDRAGGHLSAARGAARPLPDAGRCIGYPDETTRRAILRLVRAEERAGRPRSSAGADSRSRSRRSSTRASEIDAVYVSEAIENYIVDLVNATRHPGRYGEPLAQVDPDRRQPARRPSPSTAARGPTPGSRAATTSRPTTSRRSPMTCPAPPADPVLRGACGASRADQAIDEILKLVAARLRTAMADDTPSAAASMSISPHLVALEHRGRAASLPAAPAGAAACSPAATPRACAAAASTSRRSAPTCRATTSAPSTGRSPPAPAARTSASSARSATGRR